MGDFGDTMFWIFIIVDRDMGRVLSSAMVDRNILLQDMKKTLGRGGTLFDGVIEIQDSHATKVIQHLQLKGYSKAKITK